MKKIVSLGLAVAASAVIASAYPTLAGPTGMGVLPTADVVNAGMLNIAADYYDSSDSTIPVRVVYGIADNFELGVSFRSGDQVFLDDSDEEFTDFYSIEDMWGINAKWKTGLTPLGFDWSLGAQYLQGDVTNTFDDDLFYAASRQFVTDDFGDYTATQLYFVGTRNFSDMFPCPPDTIVRGTIGVNWTKVEFDEENFDEDAFRFFLGVDALFSNRFLLSAEYQTKESDLLESDGMYGITARYAFNDALAGQIGYTNEVGGVLGGDEGNFFVGLNYAFSTSAMCP